MSNDKTETMRGMGEGNREAARSYNQAATRAASDRMRVTAAARDAVQALEGPEAGALRAAEQEGKRHSKGEDPELRTPFATIPSALRDVEPDVHRKAIERANEFMAQGYDNRRAMRMGTVIALQWSENGKIDDRDASQGPAQHVMYEDRQWIIVSESSEDAVTAFDRIEDAMRKAHQIATARRSAVYVHGPDGALIDKFEGASGGTREPYHVIPRDDGWALTRLGANETYETFTIKRDAIDRGRALAREASSKLVIHYQNGDVARTHSYA